jgi:hypothetical protein
MTARILVLLLMLLLAGFTFGSGVSAQKYAKVYRFGWVSLASAPTQLYPLTRHSRRDLQNTAISKERTSASSRGGCREIRTALGTRSRRWNEVVST